MISEKSNTEIWYFYRDNGNYKSHNSVIVAGALSHKMLQPYLIDGNIFFPDDIQFPNLTEDIIDGHEFSDFIPTDRQPTINVSASEILDILKNQSLKQGV